MYVIYIHAELFLWLTDFNRTKYSLITLAITLAILSIFQKSKKKIKKNKKRHDRKDLSSRKFTEKFKKCFQ